MSNSMLGLGFGGAPIVRLDKLNLASGTKTVTFFGVDIELGRSRGLRNARAATFLRNTTARMAPWLEHKRRGLCLEVFDVGIIRGACKRAGEDTALVGATLAGAGFVPVAIGCDHSVSFWHARGVGAVFPDPLTYVYLDAHLDLGLHHSGGRQGLHNGNFVTRLLEADCFHKIVNIGARAPSTYHRVYDHAPIHVVRYSTLPRLRQSLAFLRGRPIYLSIDADVLDPAQIPNACCPEPFGMEIREVLELVAWLGASCRIVAADFSELKPGSAWNYTAEIALRLLYEAVAWPPIATHFPDRQTPRYRLGGRLDPRRRNVRA